MKHFTVLVPGVDWPGRETKKQIRHICLPEKEYLVYLFIEKNPGCGLKEMAEHIDKGHNHVYSIISRLLDKEVIYRTAEDPIGARPTRKLHSHFLKDGVVVTPKVA